MSELFEELGCAGAEPAVRRALQSSTLGLAAVWLPDDGQAFRVITLRAIDDATVRVSVRCLDTLLVAALIEVKVARLARWHDLSRREQQVLLLLMRGRGGADIATMLEIAPRTAKFHQTNALRKLGADSPLDVLRIVL
jgi:DNA-binding CsgD family transcriptional regulator